MFNQKVSLTKAILIRIIFGSALIYGDFPTTEDERMVGIRTFQVSEYTKNRLANMASTFSQENRPSNFFTYNSLRQIMGQNFIQALEDLDKGIGNMVVVNNLPTDPVKVAENITLMLLNDIMGLQCVANADIQNGRQVHHVTPRQGFEKSSSSRGKNPMSYHTDGSFRKRPFDFISLFVVRGDPEASTAFYPISDFLSQLSSYDISEMQKPQYIIHAPKGSVDSRISRQCSLIDRSSSNSGFNLRFPENIIKNVTPLTRSAKDTLDKINVAMQSASHVRRIKENGSLAIINNGNWLDMSSLYKGVLHSREGHIEDMNRLVLRCQSYRDSSSKFTDSFSAPLLLAAKKLPFFLKHL